jgi:hypothetical protein
MSLSLRRLRRLSKSNITDEDRLCLESPANRSVILENCPTLTFDEDSYVLTEDIQVAIKRHQTVIDILFTIAVSFLVMMGTICIGCGLEIEQLMHNLKRPLPVLVGLFCQIIYLPLLAVLIGKVFRLDDSTNLGLLSTASCPGEIFSVNKTRYHNVFLFVDKAVVHPIFTRLY